MQIFFDMEARVLTLFDDEDFLPKEEAPKKPVKKVTAASQPAPAAASEEATVEPAPEPRTEAPLISIELPQAPVQTEAEKPAPVPEATAETIATAEAYAPVLPEETIATEAPIEEQMPATPEEAKEEAAPEDEPLPMLLELSIDAEALTEEQASIHIEAPVKLDEAPATEDAGKAADEELNQQILSELIQLDYTALIHRDYPFDIQQAHVVNKGKARPAAVTAPEPVTDEAQVQEEQEEVAEDEVFEEVVPLPEWKLDKKYYSIGEVAHLFAVNTSHIRFWTNEFKLKPRTNRKGDRLYSPGDIAELRLIHHLVKEKKHTIKGAREKLKAGKTDVHQKLDLKESLTGLRDMLIRIREQI